MEVGHANDTSAVNALSSSQLQTAPSEPLAPRARASVRRERDAPRFLDGSEATAKDLLYVEDVRGGGRGSFTIS